MTNITHTAGEQSITGIISLAPVQQATHRARQAFILTQDSGQEYRLNRISANPFQAADQELSEYVGEKVTLHGWALGREFRFRKVEPLISSKPTF